MFFMLKGVFRIDKDIIYIGGVDLVKILKEDVVNVPLKASRTITQVKGQDLVLIGAIARAEGYQIFKFFIKSYIVESLADIKLYKDLGSANLGQSLVN